MSCQWPESILIWTTWSYLLILWAQFFGDADLWNQEVVCRSKSANLLVSHFTRKKQIALKAKSAFHSTFLGFLLSFQGAELLS